MPLGILSLKETDRLNFQFIYHDVPVLTPQLQCSEAALQFAENMTFMLFCRVCSDIRTDCTENIISVAFLFCADSPAIPLLLPLPSNGRLF
jgi:hypothetical protein